MQHVTIRMRLSRMGFFTHKRRCVCVKNTLYNTLGERSPNPRSMDLYWSMCHLESGRSKTTVNCRYLNVNCQCFKIKARSERSLKEVLF